MNDKMLALMQRRGELRERIAVQREQLAQATSRFEKPLSLLDQGVEGVRYLRRHPVLPAGAVIAVLLLRRGGVLGLVKPLFKLWGMYRSIRSLAARLGQQ